MFTYFPDRPQLKHGATVKYTNITVSLSFSLGHTLCRSFTTRPFSMSFKLRGNLHWYNVYKLVSYRLPYARALINVNFTVWHYGQCVCLAEYRTRRKMNEGNKNNWHTVSMAVLLSFLPFSVRLSGMSWGKNWINVVWVSAHHTSAVDRCPCTKATTTTKAHCVGKKGMLHSWNMASKRWDDTV